MDGKRVSIVGASRLGCEFALEAKRAGFEVTLIDEHPQSLKDMSFDAPYFYGSGLPASLSDETAVFDNVLSSNELLLECVENEVDVKIGVIAWGEFHKAANSLHIGAPKLGLVSKEGNELLEYDHLVLATGSRDFVPSFKGWELPGVLGGKGGTKLLGSYQCFNGRRCLVLGTTDLAVEFARAAYERGIEVAGFVEPTGDFQAGDRDRQWAEEAGIPVHYGSVILEAVGTDKVLSATVVSTDQAARTSQVDCDSICVAIAVLPNVELPAAMGCEMRFADRFPAWLPKTDPDFRTSVPNVYWLSSFSGEDDQVLRVLSAITDGGNSVAAGGNATEEARPADYVNLWVAKLNELGGSDVMLCQCETVTRGEFLELQPPRYLKAELRASHDALSRGESGPTINQDMTKRMTRVGMGHCQGKRCRDEAAILMTQRYGIPLAQIKPASYRFPVRPIDMSLIAAEDDDYHTREKWPHWMHEEIVPDAAAGSNKR